MTYAQVVVWMWVVALGATLVGLVLALRAVGRTERALAQLRVVAAVGDDLAPGTAALVAATQDVARVRADLHDRGPSPS